MKIRPLDQCIPGIPAEGECLKCETWFPQIYGIVHESGLVYIAGLEGEPVGFCRSCAERMALSLGRGIKRHEQKIGGIPLTDILEDLE